MTPNKSPNDMTAEEFYSGFNLDFMNEEEKQTIYEATELYAQGKIKQYMDSPPVPSPAPGNDRDYWELRAGAAEDLLSHFGVNDGFSVKVSKSDGRLQGLKDSLETWQNLKQKEQK